MKLIETPINRNLDLEYFYPNITKFVFGTKAIKFFKLYALDRTQIVYADAFDKIDIIMINTKKKITKKEIDYVIKKLLNTTREEVTVHIGVKNDMQQKGYSFSAPRKDIIVIQKNVDPS
ncbi:DUF1827 domain-containing protein [Enterococcus plantarum]|uniref:DUF1827 domain-containing protein n=1 Tax=Enterococcus plantarum TaxID=1077675 RepID=A0A2W3Z727_9ENTE|nr:DUF1827 family protein [Enterococcus plantarum]MBO0424254.1 DUF1827 family protein [Enterococcus plantarum]MBO0467025.1 DUF1827 family protein [Enterococcus plantarum]OEG13377.1 DUF1827 domain-containing protein [Enterococcus plantarum]PZL73070.1 DUF1827 domain-containing protein [Enterococcus plantarum]